MKSFKILLLAFFTIALVSCGGADERKAVYYEKAKVSLAAGDLEKARIELKNALQIDPKYAEAYYQIGKVYEAKKNYRKAYGNYLKAEELKPELLENQAKLGKFYLLLINDMDKAKEKIDFILSKEPNNSDGLLLKASYLIKEKKVDEAASLLSDILKADPGHVDSAELLTRLYVQEKKVDKAIAVLDTALETNKNNERLNTVLASVLVENKDYDRAEVLYTSFLERNPDSSASYNNLAAFYNVQGDKDKAEEMLKLSVENDTKDEERVLTLIRYIGATKGKEAALSELKSIVAQNSGLGKLRLALAQLYIENDDESVAIDVLNSAIEDFSEEVTGIDARLVLASIHIKNKDYDKANQIVNETLAISPNDAKVNFLRAKLALRDKDMEQAIISLRIVTKETPENIEAYLLLAKIYELEGNKEQVNSTLNSAYEKNKTNPAGLLEIAKFHLTRDIAKAEKIIDHYNAGKENDYEGMSIKAVILNQNKQLSEAYSIAEKLMEQFPDKANGYLQSMPYFSSINDKETALSVLEKGYLSTEDNRKILVLLTTLQTAEKKYDVVEKRLNAEIKAKPEDVELKILLSKVYASQKKLTPAEKMLEDTIAINAAIEEPYLLLSQIYQSNNKIDKAKSVLIEGGNSIQASIKIPFRLASLYEFEQSYDKAIDIYKSVNKAHPDNLIVMNNLASMLSDHGNKDDLVMAKSLADGLVDSGQPVFLDTVGWVYYKLGDYKKAITYLSQVVEKAADVNIFNYHLGMAFKMDGNKEQAKTYLEKSLANGKPFSQRELAEAALKELL